MTQDTSPVADTVADDLVDEDFETIGDYHRMAAHHFQAAAKHHLALPQPMMKATTRPTPATLFWPTATSSTACSAPRSP